MKCLSDAMLNFPFSIFITLHYTTLVHSVITVNGFHCHTGNAGPHMMKIPREFCILEAKQSLMYLTQDFVNGYQMQRGK